MRKLVVEVDENVVDNKTHEPKGTLLREIFDE